MEEVLASYQPIIDLFLAGKLPRFTHQRHVAIGNILKNMPYGRELMHLGLQVITYRLGVPEKYSKEITDFYWQRLDGTLPALSSFTDVIDGCGLAKDQDRLGADY
jgi:hypothetical protein